MSEDIKIMNFGDNFEQDECEETESMVAKLYKQKQNGNMDKARKLGEMLADEVACKDNEFVCGSNNGQEAKLLLQRRLLIAFAVSRGLQVSCPSSLIAKISSNVFFDTIRKKSPHIYESIREEGAFSYYTLCSREDNKVQDCISETFARLVGHEGEQIYREIGAELYLNFIEIVAKKVSQMNFK